MKQDEIRHRLIDGTIHVIARDGLDKATTKLIGKETETNEAYIYRCFADKEDMFAKTFEKLDRELIDVLESNVYITQNGEIPLVERCKMLYMVIWKFLLGNEDKCRCYIRYFYSPYFKKYSEEAHKENYKHFTEKISVAFKDGANVWMILNHILNVMLDFAIKVYDGAVPDNDDTAEHVFRLIFASVNQYFNLKGNKK